MPPKPSRIRDAKDVYEAFKGISRYRKERVYSVLLDGESVIGIEKVSRGSDGLVDATPDVVFRPALEKQCASVIVVHNHPSGFPYPSEQDRKTSRNLYRDGRSFGIEVADSVIIALGGYYSFEESGALQAWMEER
ncbi:MAG: JAB domain-containing protein [Thermodesulfobacteriota bacterium]|jgi:DNA repair protein RadC